MQNFSYDGSTKSGKFSNASLIQVREARGNTFDTDLKPTTTEHFAADYAKTTIVRNDKYIAGTAFRPSYNSLWDTNLPYAQSIEVLDALLCKSISAIPSGSNYLRGSAPISEPKSSGIVVFPRPEPDDQYHVTVSVSVSRTKGTVVTRMRNDAYPLAVDLMITGNEEATSPVI